MKYFIANDEKGCLRKFVTDAETLALLQAYREAGDDVGVSLVFHIGCGCGRIVEVKSIETYNA